MPPPFNNANRNARVNQPARPNPQARPTRPNTAQLTPRYAVQAPVAVGVRSQEIRATLNGSQQIAGSLELTRLAPGKGFISNLVVGQEHRRRGIAVQLISAAVTTARRQQLKSLSLEARPSDSGISPQALVAMYRRQGFSSVGKSSRGNPMMERKL